MKKLAALGIIVVIASLAWGLAMSSIANSVSNGLSELANIEMAQAMQAQAHATQLAIIGGMIGQCLVGLAIIGGLAIGGGLVVIGMRLGMGQTGQRRDNMHDRPARLLTGHDIVSERVVEKEPEDLIFANWR